MIPHIITGLIRLSLGVAAGGLAILGVTKFTKESEKSYFNNGVCKKCGGHFKPIPKTPSNSDNGYLCDVCDNCIWITFNSDKDYVYTPSKNKIR